MERGAHDANNVAYIYDLNATGGGGNCSSDGLPLGSGGGTGSMIAGSPAGVMAGSGGGGMPAGVMGAHADMGPGSVGGGGMVAGGVAGPGASGMGAPPPPPPTHIAPDENYCLRWNDYEKKYAETFRVLRDDEYFTDVTLATEGHSVKAHRVILSACSNYFHAILKTMSPWQHPVLLLQDVRSSDLNSLMDFIYFGQASVSQDSLQSFLRVAEKLKIKGLCESLAPPPPPPPPPLPVTSSSPPTPQPPPPSSHSSGGVPVGRGQTMGPAANMQPVPVSNFEGLLPRSPYIPEPSVVPLSCQTPTAPPPPPPPGPSPIGSGGRPGSSGAPPLAHQSPRQSTRPSVVPALPTVPRPPSEALAHYSTPKRAKYGAGPAPPPPPSAMSPQSILRNQLQIKDQGGQPQQVLQAGAGGAVGGPAAEHVEVKSEPMAILSTSQEDVPSSAVSEFISSHDNDLALQSLSHGISPQFMFSPEPTAPGAAPENNGGGGAGQQGQPVGPGGQHAPSNGPPPPTATLVTIDEKTGNVVTSVATGGGSMNHQQLQQQQPHHHQQQQQQQQQQHTPPNTGTPPTHHLPVSAHHLQQQQLQPQQQQQQQHLGAGPSHHRHHDEPQDLTPGPQDSPGLTHTPPGNNGSASLHTTPGTPTPGGSSGLGSPGGTPTPPKKDRNSRKTCGYCNKDFHEMSLKRHIKDVHFRSQNTYVICPQCCKQYASQNSLYSHLNRVHGVKKDMMPAAAELQQMQIATTSSAASSPAAAPAVATAPVGANNSGNGGGGGSSGAPTPTGNNHHDGIMDLAHHSDSSN